MLNFIPFKLLLGTFVFSIGINCNDNNSTENVPLSLKNVHYPIVQSNVTVNGNGDGEAKQPPFLINPDAEQIFLPLPPQNYHPDKVLERFVAAPQDDAINPYLNDLSPYILKPFVFDYTKALADAREKAKKQVFVTQPSFGEIHHRNNHHPEHGSLPINGILSISSQQQDGGNGYFQSQINKPQFAALQYQPQFSRKFMCRIRTFPLLLTSLWKMKPLNFLQLLIYFDLQKKCLPNKNIWKFFSVQRVIIVHFSYLRTILSKLRYQSISSTKNSIHIVDLLQCAISTTTTKLFRQY